MKERLLKYLETFITPRRLELITRVLDNRTKYITVVLEDIYQPHNASAVLRTCDCFGIQDVHIIENRNKYTVNPDVALGSDKWLNIYKYRNFKNNSLHAIQVLKEKGYKIVATSLQVESKSIEDYDITKNKIALFFGTELTGLSDSVLNNADEFIKIPMFGFTQSFNLSVSAAIILYGFIKDLRLSSVDWKLSENDKTELKIKWIKQGLKMGNRIEDYFNSEYQK